MKHNRLARRLLVLFMALAALAAGGATAQNGPALPYIAFSSTATPSGVDDIFVVDSTGNAVFNLTEHPARDWHPSWAPDGRRIAFASTRASASGDQAPAATSDIYIMNGDGSGVRPLTQTPAANDSAPAWSPDGAYIAYVSDESGATEIYVAAVDGGAPERLTSDGRTKGAPAWSPDGRQVAYWSREADGLVQIVNIDRFQLTGNVIIDTGNNNWPAYSPLADRLAYFRIDGETASIYAYDFARSTFAVISEAKAGTSDLHPAWSPDGVTIAFASNRDGKFQIFTQVTDGAGSGFGAFPRRLTALDGDSLSPDWQPVAVGLVGESGGDLSALGQSSQVVQNVDNLPVEAVDANGRLDIIAPAQMTARETIRVRLELRSRALIEGAAPTTAPPPLDLAARLALPVPVYTFMGAELGGFDLEQFRIDPPENTIVIQVDPFAVNYWEWRLRPRDPSLSGLQDLTARVFLPTITRDGVPVDTELMPPQDISIEVVPAQAAVPPTAEPTPIVGMALDPPNPDATIKVVYGGRDRLSLIILKPVDLSGVRLSAGRTERQLITLFNALAEMAGQAPANTCFQLVRANSEYPQPLDCDDAPINDVRTIGASDIFWYDEERQRPNSLNVRDLNAASTLAICPGTQPDGCLVPNFDQPLAELAPGG